MKISSKNIAEAVYKATEGKSREDLAPLLRRSAQILKNKRMLGKSPLILNALQNIFDKKTGTIRTKIITAKNMEHVNKINLENEIKKRYGAQNVVSEFFIKEELLGGVRIEVGDEVRDTTYKNKLYKLEKFLAKER